MCEVAADGDDLPGRGRCGSADCSHRSGPRDGRMPALTSPCRAPACTGAACPLGVASHARDSLRTAPDTGSSRPRLPCRERGRDTRRRRAVCRATENDQLHSAGTSLRMGTRLAREGLDPHGIVHASRVKYRPGSCLTWAATPAVFRTCTPRSREVAPHAECRCGAPGGSPALGAGWPGRRLAQRRPVRLLTRAVELTSFGSSTRSLAVADALLAPNGADALFQQVRA